MKKIDIQKLLKKYAKTDNKLKLSVITEQDSMMCDQTRPQTPSKSLSSRVCRTEPSDGREQSEQKIKHLQKDIAFDLIKIQSAMTNKGKGQKFIKMRYGSVQPSSKNKQNSVQTPQNKSIQKNIYTPKILQRRQENSVSVQPTDCKLKLVRNNYQTSQSNIFKNQQTEQSQKQNQPSFSQNQELVEKIHSLYIKQFDPEQQQQQKIQYLQQQIKNSNRNSNSNSNRNSNSNLQYNNQLESPLKQRQKKPSYTKYNNNQIQRAESSEFSYFQKKSDVELLQKLQRDKILPNIKKKQLQNKNNYNDYLANYANKLTQILEHQEKKQENYDKMLRKIKNQTDRGLTQRKISLRPLTSI